MSQQLHLSIQQSHHRKKPLKITMFQNCLKVSFFRHHPFLAAAAVRMNGFPHDPRSPHPGFPHPPHPMMGPGGPFFRPPFLPGGPPGDFPGAPGMIPPHGAPFMGHPGRPPFGPRPFFMHQQQLQQQQQQQQQHQQNCHVPPSVVNPVTSFHSGVVGDIRAGKNLIGSFMTLFY